MPQSNAQDEFVDLYALLGVPNAADAARIRKTIGELYLEAQKNLDHRNPRKRLQYQQMYEVYLPQARHLLLDDARRAEYDRYLKAFLSGQTYSPAPKAQEPAPKAPDLPETSAAPPAKPAELSEAEQADLWSKWKSGLQLEVAEELPPVATGAAATSTAARSSTPSPPTQPTPQSTAAKTKPTPRVAGASAEEEGEERRRREAAEFQRQQQRLNLIRSAVETAGLMWRIVAGVGVFAIGCLIVFGLDGYFRKSDHFPLNLSQGLFDALGLLIVFGIAFFVSNSVSRAARRRKNMELSMLSYEELRRKAG